MRLLTFALTILAIAGLSSFAGTSPSDRAALAPAGVVRAANIESGVVPEGTLLVVKTNDTVNTEKAYKTTMYSASVAENVVGHDEKILIPKESPVELGVRRLSYLGPGGAGMSELTVEVRSITINGVSYPVTTTGEPGAGGIGVNRFVAKVVSGGEDGSQVRASGRRIDVPVGTLLAFQLQDPVRLNVARP